MTAISEDLRRRIISHHETTEGATYASTAAHFSVGVATVNRLLRLKRETGDIVLREREKPRRFRIDLEWLREHAATHPDARLKDRVRDVEVERGIKTTVSAVWYALDALGITHKKKRSSPKSETPSAFADCGSPSSRTKKACLPDA